MKNSFCIQASIRFIFMATLARRERAEGPGRAWLRERERFVSPRAESFLRPSVADGYDKGD